MAAKSKRATKTRTRNEFDLARLTATMMPPPEPAAAYAWTLEQIVSARNDQLRGHFKRPAEMAASMRTDDAIFVPAGNRLAPPRCLGVELEAAKGARGEAIKLEAEALFGERGIGITSDTIADIQDCFVDHGVAFGKCQHTDRPDGSRIDTTLTAWPIRWVRWDSSERVFKTQTEEGREETIVHGDGRWVVFKSHEHEAWKKRAAILPSSLVWSRHAFSLADWAKGSKAHGTAKALAKLPMGVALQQANGKLSKEASAMLELLKLIASAPSPIGILPHGSEINFLTNMSQAWQIWKELVDNAERAAARIYLGSDAMLGAKGDAPGVDISTLFGVMTTLIQGDVACIERALLEGVIEPWCAMNFGDSSLAPRRVYKMPDPDAAKRIQALSAKRTAFFADLEQAEKRGMLITQEYVNKLATQYEVDPPTLRAVAGGLGAGTDASSDPPASGVRVAA